MSRRAREFTCSLETTGDGRVVTIGDTDYGLEDLPDGGYLLHKGDRASYAVRRTEAGLVECDCPDYERRRRGLDSLPCKHGRALVELGLVEAPLPAVVGGRWPVVSEDDPV